MIAICLLICKSEQVKWFDFQPTLRERGVDCVDMYMKPHTNNFGSEVLKRLGQDVFRGSGLRACLNRLKDLYN